MRAVILAGGKGTRLKPYTVVLPKPLMPVVEYPILEIIIRQLVFFGFTHITLAVNHQAEIIHAFFGNGEKWGVKIDYSHETKPLSTMGPLRLIKDLPDDFLVMNGDVLTDLDFKSFFDFHVALRNIFTISAFQREIRTEYGVLEIDGNDRLAEFQEKPIIRYDVSMGIYMVSRDIMSYIPEGEPYGFDNLMIDLIEKKKPATVKKYDGYWLDIGRPDDYAQAIEEYEMLKGRLLKQLLW